ncbi:MAG TPA: phosphate ABC transporter permease PstA [Atribacter sp.]|uniref:Phosphate transport system permease protein PstA n=1 Tax=Candidatus Atribacter allofermentans TaxID=1852833 RepID=A0A1V5SI29_9BACT|nr:phosphate ABC transporter permease PstA [Atribacter sp.]OQA54147.1 MAG: Phosphate transport system permease protein PstA [Candidatus Atribacteria bacterium ADurb.Bin276]HOT04716.1 phosphate ABC transporter permease PstA [Atribacter sp.]HQK82308.1 phosphate ABC transporter permease PstA [Atribacter sp.]
MDIRLKTKYLSQKIWFFIFFLSIATICFALGFIIYFLVVRGYKVINWEFLTALPSRGMTEGGILPAIVGTLYLIIGSIVVSLPLGVFSAVYLEEYAKPSPTVTLLRLAIHCLAGVPSVVFGLFGLGIFVKLFGFGVSLLSGSLTLGIMALPIVITSVEEALKTVPLSFREASLALGATKWVTIRRVVLPAALPGILTGLILSVGRVAGETAPILFTAAAFYARGLPRSIFDRVLALPYHIYGLMTEGTRPEKQVPIAYGTALVLLIMVLLVNFLAIYLRRRSRSARKW